MSRKLTFRYAYYPADADRDPVELEVDENAVAAVKAEYPQFAHVLDSALDKWCNGVPVARGVFGSVADPDNLRMRDPDAPGCCLIGAHTIGRLASADKAPDREERFVDGVETGWSVAERLGDLTVHEVNNIEAGFDYSRTHDRLPAPGNINGVGGAFGYAVGRALNLPAENGGGW